jgi:hypothetical protein
MYNKVKTSPLSGIWQQLNLVFQVFHYSADLRFLGNIDTTKYCGGGACETCGKV